MPDLTYLPYAADLAACLRAGGGDTCGMPAERVVSDGRDTPCRVCLDDVPAGAEMLIAAARPFDVPGPCAETDPIFLVPTPARWPGPGLPPVLAISSVYLLKGYDAAGRIVYGTGSIAAGAQIQIHAGALPERADISWIDVGSARNNCFLTRITCHIQEPT